jgi:peptide/nickel transport system substrate-binding protein
MQNRFGLKDFVLYVLVIVLGISVWLRMVQTDRQWGKAEEALTKIQGLEQQISRVENKLDQGQQAIGTQVQGVGERVARIEGRLDSGLKVVAGAPGQGSGASGGAGSPAGDAGAPASGGGDDAWSRPGVKVDRQPPIAWGSDPRAREGFQAGGAFTEIFEAQPKVMTPFISPDVYARRVQEIVLESLAEYDARTLKMHGVLAEAWQIDPEGLWLRARLRQGVRFSDGTPLTAEDIRWTFHEYMMNEQIDAERQRSIYRDSVKEVKAIDARTVEFTFYERLFTNVDNALSMFVLPKHFYSQFSPAQINQSTGLLMGSGPFRVKDLSPESQWAPPAMLVLERNEQYWGVKPVLERLQYSAMNEELARLNAFAKGDADMILPSAPQFVAKQEDPDWKDRAQFLNWINMRSGYAFIAWNCGPRNGKLTPFHDVRVRRAMTLLLDREKMIRDIWKGVGVVAKGNQPVGSPGSNPDIKPWPFDPAAAKALLKEAGWDDRNGNGVLENAAGSEFEFEYSFAGGSEIAERVARFVKDSMAAAGIKVTLRSADWSVYQDFMKKRDFDAITLGWGANAPESDPKQIFHSDAIKNQGDNFAQWASADADRLIDAGRREMDSEKRAQIWRELEKVLHEEQPYTFVRNPPWLRFVNPKIGNVVLYPKGLEPGEFFRGQGPMTPSPAN